MKSLVIYESLFGNTEKIAKAMATAIHCKAKRVDDVELNNLKSIDLLLVGSPVHGGKATFTINDFIKKIPDGSLLNKKVAAFDTRFSPKDHGLGLRLLMKIIQFASPRIEKDLIKKGGIPAGKPEGFIVTEKDGPLKKGELERAVKWAKSFLTASKHN